MCWLYIGNNLRVLRAAFFTFLPALFAVFLAFSILVFAPLAICAPTHLSAWPSKTLDMTLKSTESRQAQFILNFGVTDGSKRRNTEAAK
jgi:hypothetical protein